MQQTFSKEFKLVSKREIELIFAQKKTINNHPFTFHIRHFETQHSELKFVTAAPKRLFKKAHDRNRIKRLMREAIRKNKLSLTQFLELKHLGLHIFAIYRSEKELSLETIEKSITHIFKKIENEISKEAPI